MNEVLKAISERYSCRSFKTDMPNSEHLSLIAEAAVQAPSGMNNQPWEIIVVKNQKLIKEMENEGFSNLKKSSPPAYDRIMGRGGKLFYDAPCMIIVTTENGGAALDCGIVCQNITLSAQSLGLASVICGLAGFSFAKEAPAADFKKRLGFKENHDLGMTILIGYPNVVTEPHTPDKSKISFVE